jgi:hypothetical protein
MKTTSTKSVLSLLTFVFCFTFTTSLNGQEDGGDNGEDERVSRPIIRGIDINSIDLRFYDNQSVAIDVSGSNIYISVENYTGNVLIEIEDAKGNIKYKNLSYSDGFANYNLNVYWLPNGTYKISVITSTKIYDKVFGFESYSK